MVHVLIEGNVQGIGFRQFVKSHANKLDIKGWVKNLPDRRVEAMFVGDRSNIEKMVELCRHGPFLAEVKDVKVSEEKDSVRFDSFEIVK